MGLTSAIVVLQSGALYWEYWFYLIRVRFTLQLYPGLSPSPSAASDPQIGMVSGFMTLPTVSIAWPLCVQGFR